RLLRPFGDALALLHARNIAFEAVLPAVPHLLETIRAETAGWAVRPRIVEGTEAKYAAFRQATAALAASGTVTLELALAGVPMVVAYRVSKLEEQLKHIIRVPSIVLPNLILGETVIPELIQEAANPAALADALAPLLSASPARSLQEIALTRLDGLMILPGGDTPSARAARIVVEAATRSPG
ncbi:MAG: lipid-A-disaccharide synthase, partial [Alsobacter sp.]